MDNSYISRNEYSEHNKRMDDEHDRMNERIVLLEKAMSENNKLLILVERLALSMENMQKEQKEQGKRLAELESRDGDNWRKVSGYVLTTILGIIICYIAQLLGL